MDQFGQIGEVLGSIKTLVALYDNDISINQRQLYLLLHIFTLAYETILAEIKQKLRLEEKNTKWGALENPLRELHKIFKEGELYVRNCLDIKDWWGKALSLHQNNDCVEFHIHNLLWCFTIVIEAIETAGEISGMDQDDMQKRRLVLMKKYDLEWNDPKIFQWKYGKQYLVPREICSQLRSVWREDKWLLLETIREKRNSASTTLTKHEESLSDLLVKKLNELEQPMGNLLPAWILLGANDFDVKRRLGSVGSRCKEIHWLGESFAMRNFFGVVNEQQLESEISLVLSFSHPNIMQYLCGFYDEERKEGFLVMELLNKSLGSYIKENCGERKSIPFSLPVAVDVMLQIASGMEYLHSKKIYHGDLNPSNVLLKARNTNSSQEGYFYAKITGIGLTSIKCSNTSPTYTDQNGFSPVIWYAPEVLEEQEQNGGSKCGSKHTEKADVYSFGMLCFEILTGKVPFEEGHLQEDKMGRNIRAGERPLFPFTSPKYLVNLTRKCWQAKPIHRPSFSAICRILRYIKKCLVINPDHGQPESPPPLVDYCEIEAGYMKIFAREASLDLARASQIPFQMFAYRVVEREKTSGSSKDRVWDLGIEGGSVFGDDQSSVCSEDQERKNLSRIGGDQRSVCSETPLRRVLSSTAIGQMSFRPEFLRKVGSETPERKFFPAATADQRSVGSQTPERKTLLNPDNQKERKTFNDDQGLDESETPETKLLSSTGVDQVFDCHLETAENKISSTIAVNQNYEIPGKTTLSRTESVRESVGLKIPEKISSSRTVTVRESVGSEIPKRMNLSRTRSLRESVYSKILEKMTLSRTSSVRESACPTIPERKVLRPISSRWDISSIFSKHPKKKMSSKTESGQSSVRSKQALIAKTCKGLGTQRAESPGSSPLRTFKASPGSSPLRTFKVESPVSSPIRTPKGHSTNSSKKLSALNPFVRRSRMK
ncbi:hypothetical protein CsSME_00050599 [Camellia sinensis var. sinensis]